MNKHLQLKLAIFAALVGPAGAQTFQHRANITGPGNSDSGKCTIEVVVDGAAEIDIRGDNATLRNLSGNMPQWRRFVCTSPLPANPVNFRFQGVDGRGRQELLREPRQGGVAVVRITDSAGGAEGYTFDLMWGGGGGGFVDRQRDNQPGPPDNRGGFREGRNNRFSRMDAVRVCEDSVRQQAMQRFQTNEIAFGRPDISDNPGPQDWISGTFDVRRRGMNEPHRYSCSVNFDSGQVRSMRIESIGGREGYRDRNSSASSRSIENCERSVEERLRRDGFEFVDFGQLRVDDQPGRNDYVTGSATAKGARRSDSFNFSCAMDLQTGGVRSVDVTRR